MSYGWTQTRELEFSLWLKHELNPEPNQDALFKTTQFVVLQTSLKGTEVTLNRFKQVYTTPQNS